MVTTKAVKIKKIHKIQKPSTVCDIQIADNENLFVCNEITKKPILTHNCALIELRFNIEIRGWLLHYVARDKPTHIYKTFGDIISTKAKKRILAKIKTYDKHYGMVMNCTDFSTVRTLIEEKPCTSREVYDKRYANFGGCPLSSICFNSKRLITEVSSQWEVKEPNFLTWRRPSKLPLPKL